jgi:hypothetical protein
MPSHRSAPLPGADRDTLGRRFPMMNHVLRDRGLADRDAEFEQFAVNPRGAPKCVGLRHLADKITDLGGNSAPSGPPRSALPLPVHAETEFLPLDDGLGLDEGQRPSPIGPDSRKDDQKGPVSVQDIELVTEREVFQDQRAMELQGRQQRAEQDENHRGYDTMQL